MRIIIIILFSLFCIKTNAQNKINSYQYWFDDQYAGAVKTNITPTIYFTLSTQINTPGLLNGLHVFHIKFWDDSARASVTNSSYFYKSQGLVTANIISYQYWFDDGFNNAITQPLPAVATYSLNSLFSTTNLLSGIHILQVRFKDNNNKWSETLSHFFYKTPISATTNNIKAYQYWFDNNFSGSITQNITPASAFTFSSPVDAFQLLDGLHVLNIRFLDVNRKWSSTQSQFFYKSAPAFNNNIAKVQYWFDQQFSNAIQQTITPAATFNFSEQLNAAQLLNGLHTVSVRFADTKGKWSRTISHFFYKEKTDTVTQNKMTAYRYWFDEGDSSLNLVNIAPFMNPFILNQQIAADGLDSGQHVIHFQFRDIKGQWSMVTSDSANVATKAIYTFNGNGNWSDAANWVNKIKPPVEVNGTYQIFIDPIPGGQCILDVEQHITTGAIITVRNGKSLVIPGDLQITQ